VVLGLPFTSAYPVTEFEALVQSMDKSHNLDSVVPEIVSAIP